MSVTQVMLVENRLKTKGLTVVIQDDDTGSAVCVMPAELPHLIDGLKGLLVQIQKQQAQSLDAR